jgi:hypothetical protein
MLVLVLHWISFLIGSYMLFSHMQSVCTWVFNSLKFDEPDKCLDLNFLKPHVEPNLSISISLVLWFLITPLIWSYMFSWFAEKLKQPKQLEIPSMAYCWWAANKNDWVTKMLIYDGVVDWRGATMELIFRSIYYMLNNVVNLVKYGVFIC